MLVNLNKSTSTNFELVFPLIPTGSSINSTRSLTLNISETVLPSITLDTSEILWQGGRAFHEVGGITFDTLFVNFTVDSKFDNWLTLYKWITFINNNKDRFGRDRKEFTADAMIRVLDNFKNEILVIDIVGCWINMLGEVVLSYRNGGENLESNINLMYDRFEVRQN